MTRVLLEWAGAKSIRQYCIAVLLLACSVLPLQAAQTYEIDGLHSLPEFEFKHLGMTTQSGRFDQVSGHIILDREGLSGSVTFTIQTASLDMGYGTAQADSNGYRLFRVHEFPTIQFNSSEFFFDDQRKLVAVNGTLTMLGIQHRVTLWVNHFACGMSSMLKVEVCSCEITTSISRSRYGMLEYIPAISDEIAIRVPIEAHLQASEINKD